MLPLALYPLPPGVSSERRIKFQQEPEHGFARMAFGSSVHLAFLSVAGSGSNAPTFKPSVRRPPARSGYLPCVAGLEARVIGVCPFCLKGRETA